MISVLINLLNIEGHLMIYFIQKKWIKNIYGPKNVGSEKNWGSKQLGSEKI